MWHFNVLGPVEVFDGDRAVDLGGRRQRRLLCSLIAADGGVVSADRLAEELWDDHDRPSLAERSVRTYVSRLRRSLGDAASVVVTKPAGYALVSGDHRVDLREFERAVAEARPLSETDPGGAVGVLSDAVALWRGEVYGEFADLEWLRLEVRRLNELRRAAIEELFASRLILGAGSELVGDLERVVGEFPLSERFRGQLMEALWQAGRGADASRSFHSYRQYLAEETGLEPGAELIQLENNMITGTHSVPHLLVPAESGSRTLRRTPVGSFLPTYATSLVGREDEIDALRLVLRAHRLVTVTGVGGSGKTRLAVETAEREASTLAHGAYFVDLSSVSDEAEVVSAVAEALRLHVGGGDLAEQVLERLHDMQVLLVLDNCEHLVAACADFAHKSLAAGGDWRLLTTSRERLDVDGEHVIHVRSLEAHLDGPAVALFADRARTIAEDFVITDDNRETTARLCERLDGMPLAIELAAARIGVMSPVEMLKNIDDRFRLLSGGRRRPRQRTLHETLDWSYDLLDKEEQSLLCSIAVFVGPFDLVAAASVAREGTHDALDLLESLAAKSLVNTRQEDGTTRFYLLETVRAYAEEHLRRSGELESARDSHLAFHVESVTRASHPDLGGHWTVEDFRFAEKWQPFTSGFETAIDWAMATGRPSDAGLILERAYGVWALRRVTGSIRGRLAEVIEQLPEEEELRHRLLKPAMMSAIDDEDTARAAQLADEAIDGGVVAICIWGYAIKAMIVNGDERERTRLLELGASLGGEQNAAKVFLALSRLKVGEYELAMATLSPYANWESVPFAQLVMATILLHLDRPQDALRTIESVPEGGASYSRALVVGLAGLAVGDRETAEEVLVEAARDAASCLNSRQANNALIGMAALARDARDSQWASEVILASHRPGHIDLARMVAEQIGVLGEFDARQFSDAEEGDAFDRAGVLRDTLDRWDAQQIRVVD